MAVVSVTTDLSNVTLATSEANWGESANTGYDDFAAPSDELDFYIQGTSSVSCAYSGKNSVAGSLFYDNTTSITVPTDGAILAWQFFLAPTTLDTFANLGMFMGLGPSLNNHTFFAVSGNDYPPNPLGGWYCYALDPDNLPATVANVVIGTGKGTNGTDYIQIGGGVTSPELSKGQAYAADAIRVGRCSSIVTAGGGGNPDATFQDIADTLDTQTSRYGIFQESGGGFSMQGRLALGDGTTEVTFTDSNKNIVILPTPSVGPNFNQIQIQNGTSTTSTVVWNTVFFTNPGVNDTVAPSASRCDFVVTDNANVQFTGCSFTDMGTFVFNESGANPNTLDDVTFRSCEQVTQANATMTGCTFETSVDTVSLLTSSTTLTEFNKVTGCFFVKPTTDNHAVSFGTVNPGSPVTISFDGHSLEGYTAGSLGTFTGTAADANAAISITNNGANVTIDVLNNSTVPSVENTGTGNVIVQQQVSNTINVSDADGAVSGALVIIVNTSTNTELTSGLTNGSGIFTFNSGANIPIAVRVRKSTSGVTRYVPVETTNNTGANGTSVFVTLAEDLIASA